MEKYLKKYVKSLDYIATTIYNKDVRKSETKPKEDKAMTTYRGYTIDNITFNSKADIDNFVEAQAVEAFRIAIRLFHRDMSMETSVYADSKAKYLMREFGYTPDQIEEIELSELTA